METPNDNGNKLCLTVPSLSAGLHSWIQTECLITLGRNRKVEFFRRTGPFPIHTLTLWQPPSGCCRAWLPPAMPPLRPLRVNCRVRLCLHNCAVNIPQWKCRVFASARASGVLPCRSDWWSCCRWRRCQRNRTEGERATVQPHVSFPLKDPSGWSVERKFCCHGSRAAHTLLENTVQHVNSRVPFFLFL